MRFDDVNFKAKSTTGILLHTDDKCTLKVILGKNRAKVVQKGHCSDYDLLAGNYVKRASKVWEDDCSPRGSAETHHK
jgi:hypothetical protein